MNATHIQGAMNAIGELMVQERDYLVKLDQLNGDGDLGISMSNGFSAVADKLTELPSDDIGKVLAICSSTLNENAPSTLGTILSLFLMGMAKRTRGHIEIDLPQLIMAMESGLSLVEERAKSKVGEKTILDALVPAVNALSCAAAHESWFEALKSAKNAAADGAESTKNMVACHGRAAYYGEKSLGFIDGGAVVGQLIFDALFKYCCTLQSEK